MRQGIKNLLWMGGLIGCMLVSAGCEKTNVQQQTPPIPTQKSTMETLSIYTIDSDSMTLVPVTVKKKPGKVTPVYVASLVNESLDDDTIRVSHVEQKSDRIIVSFKKNSKPLTGCSKKMETLILDCFANSLLDNLDSCKKVVFRCENKAYKSSNYSLKINEVYASE